MSEKVTVYVRVKNSVKDKSNDPKNKTWFLKDHLLYQRIDNEKCISYLCYKKVFYEATNQDVYEDCIKPNMSAFLDGKSLTVFAYGQTGSGKTYTMTGKPNDMGIIGKTLEAIYKNMADYTECYISFFEIYNENIIDLINTNNKPRVFVYNNELIVKGIEKKLVKSLAISLQLIAYCEEKRKTGQTQYNLRSSRSHTIFKLEMISSGNTTTMTLIDLAGSEIASGSSLRFKEGVYINKSLLALGKVINSINKNEFASYRESKLTRVLQSSMTGNVTLIALCMISPNEKCIDESISTLNFASRLCQIEMRNKIHSNKELEAKFVLCNRCKREVQQDEKKLTVEEMTDSSSVDNFSLINPERIKSKNLSKKIINLHNKRIKDLESMVISLLNQNPSKRENEIFTLEKNMFNLQLEMLKSPKKASKKNETIE